MSTRGVRALVLCVTTDVSKRARRPTRSDRTQTAAVGPVVMGEQSRGCAVDGRRTFLRFGALPCVVVSPGAEADRARVGTSARRVGSGAALLVIALLVSSCSGSDGSASQDKNHDRRVVTSTSSSAADVARANAIAAYNAMWKDMAVAALTADYQSPQLAQHAAGDALVGADARSLHESGQRDRRQGTAADASNGHELEARRQADERGNQ